MLLISYVKLGCLTLSLYLKYNRDNWQVHTQ